MMGGPVHGAVRLMYVRIPITGVSYKVLDQYLTDAIFHNSRKWGAFVHLQGHLFLNIIFIYTRLSFY